MNGAGNHTVAAAIRSTASSSNIAASGDTISGVASSIGSRPCYRSNRVLTGNSRGVFFLSLVGLALSLCLWWLLRCGSRG